MTPHLEKCTKCGAPNAVMHPQQCFDCWAVDQPWARQNRPWRDRLIVGLIVFAAIMLVSLIGSI